MTRSSGEQLPEWPSKTEPCRLVYGSASSQLHCEKKARWQTPVLTCAALTRWLALLDSVKELLPGTTGRLSASAIRSCSVRAQ